MRKITVIGTLHAGLAPKQELQQILEDIFPDQLMVEIQQKDLDRGKFSDYPPEMVFAYRWAKKKNILVSGYDSDTDVTKSKTTKRDSAKLISIQKKIAKQHSWQDFNKDKYLKLLEVEEEKDMIDQKKWEKREKEMLVNIKDNMVKTGTVIILTGCGHLPFFEKKLPSAKFPFR